MTGALRQRELDASPSVQPPVDDLGAHLPTGVREIEVEVVWVTHECEYVGEEGGSIRLVDLGTQDGQSVDVCVEDRFQAAELDALGHGFDHVRPSAIGHAGAREVDLEARGAGCVQRRHARRRESGRGPLLGVTDVRDSVLERPRDEDVAEIARGERQDQISRAKQLEELPLLVRREPDRVHGGTLETADILEEHGAGPVAGGVEAPPGLAHRVRRRPVFEAGREVAAAFIDGPNLRFPAGVQTRKRRQDGAQRRIRCRCGRGRTAGRGLLGLVKRPGLCDRVGSAGIGDGEPQLVVGAGGNLAAIERLVQFGDGHRVVAKLGHQKRIRFGEGESRVEYQQVRRGPIGLRCFGECESAEAIDFTPERPMDGDESKQHPLHGIVLTRREVPAFEPARARAEFGEVGLDIGRGGLQLELPPRRGRDVQLFDRRLGAVSERIPNRRAMGTSRREGEGGHRKEDQQPVRAFAIFHCDGG